MSNTLVNKRFLSESVNGKAIKVHATGTPGTLIHTAQPSEEDGNCDEPWLWATNNHTDPVVLTIETGDGYTENTMTLTLPVKSGWIPLEPGFDLNNSVTIKAFASVADVVSIRGFINRMTE